VGETCRLRYTNPNGEDEVIAVLNPLEESDVPVLNELSVVRHFKEFTRLKISGDKELVDTFPVLKEDFGGDVPEIFVDWYSFEEEQWFSVARVYPVDGGGIDQVGMYKNTSLYGFEKFVGEQRTDVTDEDAVTTDIVDALQIVLDNSDSPESYVVEAPTDSELSASSEVDFDERPRVEEFSFQGDCQKAFRDLRKYGWVIMFTAEKDGGDVVVRFEPVGWGGIEASLNGEEDPLYFDYWKKKDLSTIVSDVEVIGVDADGEEVKVRKIKDAPRDKYKRFNIGWIQSESEAESVAENQLQLEPVEHGKLETFIFPQNTLNYSIDVFDSEKGVDGVFTVAHQKDLFHSGQTEFSFEFERELTDQERDILRTQDERNNELNTVLATDVGNQNVSGSTETVSDRYDDFGDDNHEHKNSNTTSDLNNSFLTKNSLGQKGDAVDPGDTLSVTARASDDLIGGVDYVEISIMAKVRDVSDYNIEIKNDTQGLIILDENFTQSIIDTPAVSSFTLSWDIVNDNDRFILNVTNLGADVTQMDLEILVASKEKHDHGVEISSSNKNNTGGNNSVNEFDSSAGDTSNLDTDGNTDPKNIDVSTQNKTDR